MISTTYTRDGIRYQAIQLAWTVVAAILGHEHAGTSQDDDVLVAHLIEQGAPAWVRDAEGWIDDAGWGLIGPAQD